MKKASIVVVVLGVLAIGCNSSSKKTEDTPMASASVAEVNSAKLSNANVPQAVRDAFAKEHATAAISSVQLRETSPGTPFWQINFIQGGQPGAATYYPSGKVGPTY